MNSQRYSRQEDIIPYQRIEQCQATVIGVGAIGRQVTLQLAAMGIQWLQLIDYDVVEETNIASQGYLEKDLHRLKVDATAELCLQINSELLIQLVNQRFRRSMEIGDIVFACVDSISTRQLIWDAVKNRVRFFCDGRMAAEVLRVLTACDQTSMAYYPSSLFSQDQAFRGACTAKSTIYCANLAAGLMLSQFAKYLRQLPLDYDIQLNLLACEMNVGQCEH